MLHSLRRFSLRASLLVLALINVPLPVAKAQRQWNHGDPSPEEQYALEVFNRVRADPYAAADFYSRPVVLGQNSFLNAMLVDRKVLYDYIYADGVVGSDMDHGSQTPAGIVYGAQATKGHIHGDLSGLDWEIQHTTPPTPINGRPPPFPPLAFYPLFSEQARSQGEAAIGGSPAWSTRRGYSSVLSPPASDAMPLPSKPIPFRACVPPDGLNTPALSGSNATGGVATIQAGRMVGNNAGWRPNFNRLDLLYIVNYYRPEVTLRESFMAAASGSYRGMCYDVFTVDSLTAGPTQAGVYGKAKMAGVYLSPVKTDDPSKGSRFLSLYTTDNEALSSSDLPFGNSATVFITGVAYADKDFDGDYTPGEGAPGVKVTLDSGEWFAVTSRSGGYAIPVRAGSGTYTVTFTGTNPTNDTPFTMTKTVTVGGTNVKVDSVLPPLVAKTVQRVIPGSSGKTQFSNLSARGIAEAGANALTAGFVITGTGSKTLLIRGVSNTLAGFGVTGVLQKPLLTLYGADGKAIKSARTQDTYDVSWPNGYRTLSIKSPLANAFKQAGAFDFALTNGPGNSSTLLTQAGAGPTSLPAGDTAMVVSLPPGSYSVSVTPDADTWVAPDQGNTYYHYLENIVLNPKPGSNAWADSGVVLLELYDLTPESGSRFVNLSTRGRIESGPRQMFIGFSIAGDGNRRLLARGVSPSLRAFGLSDVLDDPVLTVFDAASQPLDSNDNWGASPFADQISVLTAAAGGFPLDANSLDAATLVRITPGNYTIAIAPNAGQPYGVALAELYLTDN